MSDKRENTHDAKWAVTKRADVPPWADAKGQGKSAPATVSVFEAVDASSDEQYCTVGIWLTLEAAIAAFRKLGDNEPGEDIADGVKIVEIRERKIGELDWAETGKVVAKFVWRKDYREADDSYEWRITNVELCHDRK